jgi:GNAT superfamily N-acetyltransferase
MRGALPMKLVFTLAGPADSPALAELRSRAARALTERYGQGHWSAETSERGAVADLRHAEVWIARRRTAMVGTFRLATKKPWAIDRSYFSDCKRPIYLTNMAVHPDLQGQGIGRRCLEHAIDRVRDWPGDSICLDAYDADAGAGAFYAKCGFREVGRVVYRSTPLIYYELLL